jgi:hypothetical protein
MCIAGFLIIVSGCTSRPEPIVVIKDNKEKDLYIDKLEGIVSDAGAGITAVLEVTPRPSIAYSTLEAENARLGGIKPPTVAKLAEKRLIIKNNDTKAVAKDKVEAEKVDKETSVLYAKVVALDSELAEANLAKELAIEAENRAVKSEHLYMITCVGIAMFAIGAFVVAFTPKKVSGGIICVFGALATSVSWVFDTKWFGWIAGLGFGLVVGHIVILVSKKTFDYLRAKRTGQDENGEQSNN